MTDARKTPSSGHPEAGWTLQDAKAGFSELVRRACTEGPQRVTVCGHDAVVVISAGEMERLPPTGETTSFLAFMESLDTDGLDLARDRDTGRDTGL